MRINPYSRPDINPYQNQPKQPGQQMPKQASDQVEISAAAKQLQKTDPFETERKARVEQLKMQVQSGEYKVSPKAVAKGIANFYFNK
jgi:negative regulator of flagellin synthesis FlgM